MSHASSRHLLSPVDVGPLTLANRVAMAPMTRARAGVERMPNALMAEYYRQRAGAGLIITEGAAISPQALGWVETPGIYTERQAEAWRQIVEAVHGEGSRVFLQLWHCGRTSHSSFQDGALPVAPSAVKMQGDGVHTPHGKQPHETPRALTTDEVATVVDDYAAAARRAQQAGFDGVEIHGGNGYLIDQFLQSRTNLRDDRYGGSVENRYRFLGEVVDAVTAVMEPGRVAVRLSPNGAYNDMGSPDYRETFTHAARELDRYGLAYLHVMDGLAFGFHQLGEPMTLAEFRAVFRGPVMANCGYTRESAESAVAAGLADLVSFGRPFISNPDLVERFRHGWPLAGDSDPSTWYAGGVAAEGYTTYPNHQEASA